MAARLIHASPQLFTTDIGRAVAYYARLGFAVNFVHGEPPFYGQIARDGVTLNLRHVDAMPADAARVAHDELLSAYITAEGIDELFTAFWDAGAEFARPLKDMPWGAREFVLRDPDGNLICFAGA